MASFAPDAAGVADTLAEPDVETCLRVLEHARAADPGDPRWAPVREAAARLYHAGKKAKKAARYAERRRHDLEAMAASERFAQQDPSPEPASPEQAPASLRPLVGTRRCYVCKTPYGQAHSVYHLLCPDCARESLSRRDARCDLGGRTALVTGGRIKIGFHVALKMLRDGAEVLVTTRFPRDAARCFAAVRDSALWLDRLHVHGVDLLDVAGVAGLLDTVHERFAHLDILVNNAAQTIRRPPAYHQEVRAAEEEPLSGPAARIAVTGSASRPAPTFPGTIALPDTLTAAYEPAGPPFPADRTDEHAGPLFPAGRTDETGQPLDLRERNSWSLRLHEVDPAEWLEVQFVNAFGPFLLTSRLRGLMEASPYPDRYVVQVSAMEGSFSRVNKTVRHPHTNMAKASLNMLTRTAAADYAASGIHMNSVDTGWVTDERPHPEKTAQRRSGFRPPLDVIDGAARVYDPIVRGVGGQRMSGLFLKDYRPVEW
ncbi:SDR family NAD(P)-dependent oxidoreductase [Planotetraspora kaengkrachanensis]|uniref:Oxidoreductase n=1 Tax=Planotetraspora kaengkrachanensis TaxID=575193 RepID=A0A8J3PXE8_9ACTN|nr:SDR family oxidoreductase [Planotetraspora kaengkrachanensis]GIG82732.1 oxidoreductase [Planotetraspora kaengkrachanensis]